MSICFCFLCLSARHLHGSSSTNFSRDLLILPSALAQNRLSKTDQKYYTFEDINSFVILPVFSSATPVIATPTSKRKQPMESGHSFGFSNKKRRSVKKTLGIELLPNTLFSGVSTPGSGIDGCLIKRVSTIRPSLKPAVKCTSFSSLFICYSLQRSGDLGLFPQYAVISREV